MKGESPGVTGRSVERKPTTAGGGENGEKLFDDPREDENLETQNGGVGPEWRGSRSSKGFD